MSLKSALIALFLTSTSIFAQVAGRLSGSVVDSSGAAISGASVKLTTRGGAVAGNQSTTSDGIFSFAGLQPGTYEVEVEMNGFALAKVVGVKVDTARETPVGEIALQPAAIAQTVDVTADIAGVQTANAEISTVVTNEQVRRLPIIDRGIVGLITSQPGTGSSGRTPTTINGLRVSYANVTLDGVNIQDNFLRENSLDYQPNLLLLDQVSEMTLATSNTTSSMGFGATQVALSTPSGGNSFHGAAFWYNRNNALAANDFFSNRDGLGLPFLNQNQAGGSISGPIVKNKLFFYANFEAFRRRQQSIQQRTILTDTARQGIFTYRNTAGLQQVNLLQLAGRSMDPMMQSLINQVPGSDKINNFRTGDSNELVGLRNTGGYSFLSSQNRDRNNATGRLDYYVNDRHSLFGTYLWNTDKNERPTVNQLSYSPTPEVTNDNSTNFTSMGWNSTWSPNFVNELRGGFNFAPGNFLRSTPDQSAIFTDTIFSNPIQTYMPQGRDTKTWNISDNANWVKGRHTMRFGFQMQNIRVNSWDRSGTIPTYRVGIPTGAGALTTADLPGINATDLTNANSLLASLAGLLMQGTQNFNVTDRASGFVPGAENRRIYNFNTFAWYFNDAWRVTRKINITAGLRYEYQTRLDEARGLALLPVLQNNNPIETLLSPNGTLDFAGSAVGRPWYNKDLNNFAPNAGLTWDILGDGKTIFRAGYSLNFVNDNVIVALQNSPTTNSGLQSTVTPTYQNQQVFASAPRAIPTPAFNVPRTYAENYAINSQGAFAMIDPNLRTPYVQQWSAGVQRELAGGVLEARYVGNHATKQFRAFDYNQVDIYIPGYLTDFRNAYNNGLLTMNAGGAFNPSYNPAIQGSQPLPFFAQLPNNGYLTDATVSNSILQQQVGQLANIYQTNRLNGPVNFFRNPYALGTNMQTNYSNATYHSFQVDYARRFSRGFSYQANYVFSKSLSDSAGDNQSNFEPFLDINNGAIEKSRTPFDIRHAFKVNFVIELPVGKGKKYFNTSNAVASRLISGWSVSGLTTLQSGFPFSIRSERGTLNRTARSTNNTVGTSLTGDQLNDVVGLYMTGNGPYIIAQSAINTDGRGVGPDGRAPFNGQVFFNPGAGDLGGLQRRYFTGPKYFNFDFAIHKLTTIREGHSLEFRMETFNIFNNVMFDTTQVPGQSPTVDYNVNNTTFGRIITQANTPRRIQFGLYYRF